MTESLLVTKIFPDEAFPDKVDISSVTDNNKFSKAVSPIFSDKISRNEK